MPMPANKGIEYRIVDRNIYFFGISVLYYNSSWNEYGMVQSNFSREEYKSGQHALDSASVKKLLLSFSNLQDKAMISLACSTGIRREDLVSIKQNDYKCEYDEQKSKYIATVTFFEQKKKRTRTIYISSQETIQLINISTSLKISTPHFLTNFFVLFYRKNRYSKPFVLVRACLKIQFDYTIGIGLMYLN